jgi:beta-glucosidase
VKHFALNNQEAKRHYYNAVVDDRALYEIYLPAFKAAVQEGGAWSIMGAYNLFEGYHLCHNDRILNKILKQEWGFDGAVISDWGGVHNTEEAIANGLDLEFGTGTNGLDSKYGQSYDAYNLALPYEERLKDGRASMEVLNDKVRRVLRLNFRTALNSNKPSGSLCSPEHYAAARKIAGEGIVLLKNEDNILPLDLEKTKKILVVGENAIKKMTVGGGSSSLKAQYECTPIVGLREAVGDKAEIVYQRGYVGDLLRTYNNVDTGIDLTDPRSEEQLIADAVAEAADADVVLFFGGLNKSKGQDAEGRDRLSMALPYAQDKVIEALAEVNDNVVVLIVSGNAVEMPWIDKVDGIVETWFLGSQAGHAIADVLLGKVNPSGKLPFTFPVKLEDNGAHALNAYHKDSLTVEYKEGLFVGYRWAEKHQIKPLFAFGHGLSYTTFEYGEAKCRKSGSGFKVSVNVTNTGAVEGKEIVQLYVGDDECTLERPVKELKGFKKISLAPGETKKVTFEIEPEMLKFYDPARGGWVLENGTFTFHVGAASDDIRTTCTAKL